MHVTMNYNGQRYLVELIPPAVEVKPPATIIRVTPKAGEQSSMDIQIKPELATPWYWGGRLTAKGLREVGHLAILEYIAFYGD